MAQIPPIEVGSVKVMRSHDYCHFEVCLSSSAANTPELVDELRKTAARLADKAVEQYKVAKRHANLIESESYDREFQREEAGRIEAMPETERTPQEQANLKAYKDKVWADSREYDYEDDWQES